MLSWKRAPYDLASAALAVTVAVLVLATFQQYGVTWDEPVQHYYGRLIARYYYFLLHGRYDPSAVQIEGMSLYGGLFDTTAALVAAVFPSKLYETRHLLNAAAGVLGIAGCWKLARLLGGAKAAFWAALLLILTPRYYGAMFNNPKDIPFAAGYVWSIYYLALFSSRVPDISWGLAAKLGCAIGAALAVRIGGLLLLGYLGLVVASYAVAAGLSRRVIALAAGATGIAWTVMLLFWPWAQQNPLLRPPEALWRFTHAYPWPGSIFYDGHFIKGIDAPRTYMLRWLSMTLPEILLAALALGAVFGLIRLWRGPVEWRSLAPYGVLIFSVVFPLAYIVGARPVLYDGERHFLYVVPPVAALAGLSYAWLSDRLALRSRAAAVVLGGAVCVYIGWQVTTMARLHPNEYVYFNSIVGGLPGASACYDTDYWGNTYREAILGLRQYLRSTGNQAGRTYKIMALSKRESSSYYFPKNFTFTRNPAEADFLVTTTHTLRYAAAQGDERVAGFRGDRVVVRVARLGVPLALVEDRRGDGR